MRDSVLNCIYRDTKNNDCSCPFEKAKGRTGCTIAIRGYDIDCGSATQKTLFNCDTFMKKPIEVDAMQFTEESKDIVFHWIKGTQYYADFEDGKPVLRIKTLEGVMTAKLGDWIIRGIAGEYYPCKPDVFKKLYDKIE